MKRNYTCFLLKRRFIAYLCVGLVINCTPSARQRTYYEQLYADSAFITCEGDLNKPGVIDQQETAYESTPTHDTSFTIQGFAIMGFHGKRTENI